MTVGTRVRDGSLDGLVEATPATATETLVQAVRDLAAARDLHDVIAIVQVAARRLVDADGATFVLRDGEHCHYVAEDAIEPLWRGQRFPMETCISGWAMRNRRALHIPDVTVDHRIPQDAYRPTFVRSLAMTPVRTAAPVAAIGTYWADHRTPTRHEMKLLQSLADSTAVALEHVRLLEELEQRVDARTAELTRANTELARANVELAAKNEDLRSVAHLAAHDLRSPLTTIRSFAEYLDHADGAVLSEGGTTAVAAIVRQSDRLDELIQAILAHATAAAGALVTERVAVDDVVADVVADLHTLVVARGARVVVGALPDVTASRPLLARVVQNLIGNAIVHGAATDPVVHVSGRRTREGVELVVSDDGPGVPVEHRERIFELFHRGAATDGASGSGIGLAFARRVVEHHGGTIAVDEAPEGGARFTVLLPA